MHVGGAEALLLRSLKIAGMRGHHHHLWWSQVEELHGAQIRFRIRLVVAHQFRAEDAVPRYAAVFGHVGEQRDVAVGERRDCVARLQTRQASNRIWPRPASMPHLVELHLVGFSERSDLVLLEERVERHPVEHVQLGPRQLALAHAVHRRTIRTAPLVGERRPIKREALGFRQRGAFLNHHRAPVHNGAKGVEDHHLDVGEWAAWSRPRSATLCVECGASGED